MDAEKGFSLREAVKNYFFPFKNKWANASIYALGIALGAAAAYYSEQSYKSDLAKYDAGEIAIKPALSDYSPIGQLEKWVIGEKDNQPGK